MSILSSIYVESGSIAVIFFALLYFLFRRGVKDINYNRKERDNTDLRKDVVGKNFIMKNYRKPKKQ